MKKLIFVLSLTMSLQAIAGAINPVSVCDHQEVVSQVVKMVNQGDLVFKGASAHNVVDVSEVISSSRTIQCLARVNYTNGHSIWVKYAIMTNSNVTFVSLDMG